MVCGIMGQELVNYLPLSSVISRILPGVYSSRRQAYSPASAETHFILIVILTVFCYVNVLLPLARQLWRYPCIK
jgi:hypothetical protein